MTLAILILHGGGVGGMHKVPALISKIRIFATNNATATKFGDFSWNLLGWKWCDE